MADWKLYEELISEIPSDLKAEHIVVGNAFAAVQCESGAVGGELTRTQRERRIALSEAAPWRSKGMDCVFSVYFERRKAQKMSNKRKAQKARKPA